MVPNLLIEALLTLDSSRVASIFEFLQRHHAWNADFMSREYCKCLSHCDSADDRLKHLLHFIAHTQSAPRLQNLGKFWRKLHEYEPAKRTVQEFTAHLAGEESSESFGAGPWSDLFESLKVQSGWGNKTAALFVKATIQIHRRDPSLHFWPSSAVCPTALASDRIYLPVDSVITHIFKQLGLVSPNFQTINDYLLERFDVEQMLIWDDLWYWGFITQRVSKAAKPLGKNAKRTQSQIKGTQKKVSESVRATVWNQDKFWSQLSYPWSKEADVRPLVEEFIALVS